MATADATIKLTDQQRHQEATKVALASLIGATIEWYDFFLYATMSAIVFPAVFFSQATPLVGVVLSYSTLALGYFARPLGAIFMGHYGDKLGRKAMLVFSLVLMGSATTLIGLLPPASSIGAAAPVILIVLRLLQGFAVGGEAGGAITMAVEHAPENRRGLYGGFPQLGVAAGLVMANLIILAATVWMSKEDFNAYGWRIPFLISVLLLLVGVYVRLKISESPIFNDMKRTGREAIVPLVDLFTLAWKPIIIVALSTIFTNVMGFTGLVYMLGYGTGQLGFPRQTILWFIIIANLVEIPATLYFASLSDTIGRRTMVLWGLGVAMLWGLAFFPLANTKEAALVFIAILGGRLCISSVYGPQAAQFSELFDTKIRFSGISIGYAISSVIGAQTPIVLTWFVATGLGVWAMSGFMFLGAFISFIAVLLMWETYKVDLKAKLNT